MAANTVKVWTVLTAMVRTFQGDSAARAERARKSASPRPFGTQTASYGISSMVPPMR